MTRASAARVARQQRGRPRRDYSDDPDLEVAEWALALQAAWGMSERASLDLALAVCQGVPDTPTKIPRAAKAGFLVGYALPRNRAFHSRAADIRHKLQTGRLCPDERMVLYTARILLRIRRL
jgi:hypothetical protein